MPFHALGTTTSGYIHLFICSQCHSATWTKIRALFCWVHIENWFCLNKLKSKQMRQSHSSGTSQRFHIIFPAWAKKAPAELQINLVLPGLMNHGFLYTYTYIYRKNIYKLCLWEQLWAHTWIKVSWVHTVQEALSSVLLGKTVIKLWLYPPLKMDTSISTCSVNGWIYLCICSYESHQQVEWCYPALQD